MAVAAELPEDQLRAAWSQVRRADWPDTFEEAMADPVRMRLVRMTALHPTPLAPVADRRELRTLTSLPPRWQTLPRPRVGYVDHKRAAAGDRDDD